MSRIPAIRSQYSDRLNRVQEELLLTDAAIRYIKTNMDRPEISRLPEFALAKRAVLDGMEERMTETYFIRLTAEFEGILNEHLNAYYPVIAVPDNANFDWLMSRVFRPKKTSNRTYAPRLTM